MQLSPGIPVIVRSGGALRLCRFSICYAQYKLHTAAGGTKRGGTSARLSAGVSPLQKNLIYSSHPAAHTL